MRWRIIPDDEWRKGFAWFPVDTKDQIIWLEPIEWRPKRVEVYTPGISQRNTGFQRMQTNDINIGK